MVPHLFGQRQLLQNFVGHGSLFQPVPCRLAKLWGCGGCVEDPHLGSPQASQPWLLQRREFSRTRTPGGFQFKLKQLGGGEREKQYRQGVNLGSVPPPPRGSSRRGSAFEEVGAEGRSGGIGKEGKNKIIKLPSFRQKDQAEFVKRRNWKGIGRNAPGGLPSLSVA